MASQCNSKFTYVSLWVVLTNFFSNIFVQSPWTFFCCAVGLFLYFISLFQTFWVRCLNIVFLFFLKIDTTLLEYEFSFEKMHPCSFFHHLWHIFFSHPCSFLEVLKFGMLFLFFTKAVLEIFPLCLSCPVVSTDWRRDGHEQRVPWKGLPLRSASPSSPARAFCVTFSCFPQKPALVWLGFPPGSGFHCWLLISDSDILLALLQTGICELNLLGRPCQLNTGSKCTILHTSPEDGIVHGPCNVKSPSITIYACVPSSAHSLPSSDHLLSSVSMSGFHFCLIPPLCHPAPSNPFPPTAVVLIPLSLFLFRLFILLLGFHI